MIRVLDDEMVNLISAGEVVERPASIVKELVENSLDAGASRIEVEVEQGGRRSITVRDDGCGMSRHDLLMSIQRHATSKVSKPEDLGSIATLGFRGEALPSIAAVTHTTIVTSDGGEGWRLDVDGGILRGVAPAARTRGTTVTAAGIFFNQPPRRKFLRSEQTELSWIRRHLEGIAFSRDDFALRLSGDGQGFELRPGTLEERMRARFSIDAGERCVTGSAADSSRRIELLVFPGRCTATRLHSYVSLNGRAASVRTVTAVLEQLLAGPAGYPLLACRLVLEPGDVDVNAHPSKLEVRLREPSRIAALVEQAAESAVSGRRSVMSGAAEVRGSAPYAAERPDPPPRLFERAMELQSTPARAASAPGAQVMQVGRSYLVSSLSGGLVIVDPHAAHERVLFDSIRKGSAGTQQLLLPEPLDLDPESMEQLQMHRDMLKEAGFDFSETGQGLMLCAVPAGLRHGVEAVSEILSHLSDPVRAYLPPQEMIAAAAACAGAVKLGDPLDPAQAAELVDMLFATSDPFRCPHGRPTLIEITDDELGRRFGR